MYDAAIIGLGKIGARRRPPRFNEALGRLSPHSHAEAIEASPLTRLTAACDISNTRIRAFKSDWPTLAADAKFYPDAAQLLATEKIQLLTIAVPDHLHVEVIRQATASGSLAGILCEKPLATTVADAEEIVTRCHAGGTELVVNHTRRFMPEYLSARQVLQSGEIGQLSHIVASWGGPRAMLFRNGSHLVDAVQFITGCSPQWVTAHFGESDRGYPPRYAGDGGTNPEHDPGIDAIIGLEGGARAYLVISKTGIPVFECDIHGTKGRIRVGSNASEIWTQSETGNFEKRTLEAPLTMEADTLAAIHTLIKRIGSNARRSAANTNTQEVRTVETMVACLQSAAREGTKIEWPIADE